MFQNDRLMPWRTAIENVALGLELNKVPESERPKSRQSWLARLGLSGHEYDYPHALSGGMRQRVSIARAFAAGPTSCSATSRSARSTSIPATRCATNFATFRRDRRDGDLHHPFHRGALWLGGRLMVFERPARIAYETRLHAGMTERDRDEVRANIRRSLAA